MAAPGAQRSIYLKTAATTSRKKQECRTGLPNDGKDLLEDADIALATYVVKCYRKQQNKRRH
jgi:hypothetical protein